MEVAAGSMEGTLMVRSKPGLVSTNTARSALLLGAFLCVLQAADGILTSLGISRYGIDAEGNPILRHLMYELGHIPALGLVKALAILTVIGLTCFAKKLPWVNQAMGAISCLYVFAAIVPWTYVLFIKPYLA